MSSEWPRLKSVDLPFVGRRIRDERQKAGMSLAKLAQVTELSKTYLLRLETDETSNPSLDVLHRIAEALDITVADLLGRPRLAYDADSDEAMSSSLRAFVDEEGLSQAEIHTLQSIRWRQGDEPQTTERWRFVYQSLTASREIDRRNRGDG
jgi:transcriptional regulator with XRE-family HTH domain